MLIGWQPTVLSFSSVREYVSKNRKGKKGGGERRKEERRWMVPEKMTLVVALQPLHVHRDRHTQLLHVHVHTHTHYIRTV